MKFLAAAGLAGACLATSPLFAADLFSSAPPPMDEPAYQSELGSNWYIRGEVGYGELNQATIVPQAGLFPPTHYSVNTGVPFNGAPIGDANSPAPITRGNNKTTMGADFGFGLGYRLNDWFRVEAEYSFFKGPGFSSQTKVFCPGQAVAVSNYSYDAQGVGTAHPIGYSYDWNTCNGYLSSAQYNNTGLIAGYVDLGHWSLFTPYVGAGAGINANSISGSVNYYNTGTGTVYQGPAVNGNAPATWVEPTALVDQKGNTIYKYLYDANGNGPQMSIGPQNWHRSISSTKYTFAGMLTAGLGVKISQSATLDIGYKMMTLDISRGMKDMRQSLNLGVRYNIN